VKEFGWPNQSRPSTAATDRHAERERRAARGSETTDGYRSKGRLTTGARAARSPGRRRGAAGAARAKYDSRRSGSVSTDRAAHRSQTSGGGSTETPTIWRSAASMYSRHRPHGVKSTIGDLMVSTDQQSSGRSSCRSPERIFFPTAARARLWSAVLHRLRPHGTPGCPSCCATHALPCFTGRPNFSPPTAPCPAVFICKIASRHTDSGDRARGGRRISNGRFSLPSFRACQRSGRRDGDFHRDRLFPSSESSVRLRTRSRPGYERSTTIT